MSSRRPDADRPVLRRLMWLPLALGLAVVYVAAERLLIAPGPAPTAEVQAPDLSLDVNLSRDGQPLPADAAAQVGDLATFQARSTPAGRAVLTVKTEGDHAALRELMATPEGVDVQDGEGLLRYRFEATGTHRFLLVSAGAASTTSRTVEVREGP
ncbi:MAG: hypothetical protein H6739_03580 [Alphaproteobacteria bacterium]|nr:hypothetical protein [Alphaproteobacteria bacterium]